MNLRLLKFVKGDEHLLNAAKDFLNKEIEREYKRLERLGRYKNKYEKELMDIQSDLFFINFSEKVYRQRNFPTVLRNYIFNRDNFTCQICNIHKSKLQEGIHLEIDHIIAWQDGGQTTLSNGQTVCSDCNKGKHHAKKYLNKETT